MTCTFCVTEDNFAPMGFDEAVALLEAANGNAADAVALAGQRPRSR